MIKKTLLILMAAASLTVAKAELIYEKEFKPTWADPQHSHVVMAKQLTDAAHRWMAEAQAQGYSEAECISILKDAYYQHKNTLPKLPESRPNVATQLDKNQRVIAHGTVAAVGTASLESVAFALCSEGVGKIEQGEMIIKGLIATGVAIDLNPGDVVTLRGGDSIPVPGMDSTVSGVNIIYHGLDYIMIQMEDTFKK
jgi:hypothetical protein